VANSLDVTVVGSTAAADDPQLGQKSADRPIFLRQLLRVARI
jgi:hypothetical protein